MRDVGAGRGWAKLCFPTRNVPQSARVLIRAAVWIEAGASASWIMRASRIVTGRIKKI